MAHRYNSQDAARARRQKGARHAHEAIRATGRTLGVEATAERMRRRALDNALRSDADALLDTRGSQLEQMRRIARAENLAPDADDADAGVILDGI